MNVSVCLPNSTSKPSPLDSTPEGESRREWLLRGWRLTPEEAKAFDTPLLEFFAAAREGRIECLREALDQHPQWATQRGPYAMDALMFSARYGHTSSVQLLLERGASPKRTVMELDALRWALRSGHLDCAQLLLPSALGGTRCDRSLWLRALCSGSATTSKHATLSMVPKLRQRDARWLDPHGMLPLGFVCQWKSLAGVDFILNGALPKDAHGPLDARATQEADAAGHTPLMTWMDIDWLRNLQVYDSDFHRDARFLQLLRASPIRHLNKDRDKDALDLAIEHGYWFAFLALMKEPNRPKAAGPSLGWLRRKKAHGWLETIARFDRWQNEERTPVGQWGGPNQTSTMSNVRALVRKNQWKRLCQAIESENSVCIEQLLRQSPRLVKQCNVSGETPLLFAARRSKANALAQLLPHSDRLAQRHDGLSALMLCLLDRQDDSLQGAATRAAELLLRQQVKEQAILESVAGRNAVSFARLHQNAQALKQLLPHSKPLIKIGKNELELHVLSSLFEDFEEVSQGHERTQLSVVLDELVALCPPVENPKWKVSAALGYENALKDLWLQLHSIQKRSSGAKTVNENTLGVVQREFLGFACLRGSLSACQSILSDPQAAALLCVSDAQRPSETPMHLAIESGDEETLRWLLTQPQVGPHVRTKAMGSVLCHAVRLGCAPLLRVLIEVWDAPPFLAQRDFLLKGIQEGLEWLFRSDAAFEQDPPAGVDALAPEQETRENKPPGELHGGEPVPSSMVSSAPTRQLNLWQELFVLLWSVAKTDAKLQQWTLLQVAKRESHFAMETILEPLNAVAAPADVESSGRVALVHSSMRGEPSTPGCPAVSPSQPFPHHDVVAAAMAYALCNQKWEIAQRLVPFVSGEPLFQDPSESSALMLAAVFAPLDLVQALTPNAQLLQRNASWQSALALAVASGNAVNARWLASRGHPGQWLERDRNGLVPFTRYILRCSQWNLKIDTSNAPPNVFAAEVRAEHIADNGEEWRKEAPPRSFDPQWARWLWEQTQAASEAAGCAGQWIEHRNGLLHRLVVGLTNPEFAQEWLEKTLHHFRPEHQSDSGHSALKIALEKDSTHALARLLLLRADPTLPVDGCTPLMWAAEHGWEEELSILIPKSALNLTNRQGWTVLGIAVGAGHLECAKRLWEAQTSEFQDSKNQQAQQVKRDLLGPHGVNEGTLLHHAAYSGRVEMLEWVIELSSDWPVSWSGCGPLCSLLLGSSTEFRRGKQKRKNKNSEWMRCTQLLFKHHLGLVRLEKSALKKWTPPTKDEDEGGTRAGDQELYGFDLNTRISPKVENATTVLDLLMDVNESAPHHRWLQQELLKLVPSPSTSSHFSRKSLWQQATDRYAKMNLKEEERDEQGSWFMKGLRQHEAWRERQALAQSIERQPKEGEEEITRPAPETELGGRKQTKRL